MKSPLINSFEVQIKSLGGFNFQDFVTELFMMKFGDRDFESLRKVKDKGCDGIIRSEQRIIACYGVEKYDYNQFLSKAKKDFSEYQTNWESRYPNWTFVINKDSSPELRQVITDLKTDAELIGLRRLILFIEELDSSNRRKLGRLLNINEDFFADDYIKEILEDLHREPTDKTVKYNKAPYIPEKIELNYTEAEDIDAAIEEFETVMEDHFGRIESILAGYDDGGKNRIKVRIIGDYNAKSGEFKKRLEQQTQQYLSKYSPEDDNYLTFIRAILLYHFEQCIIGIKTEAEKNDSTTS